MAAQVVQATHESRSGLKPKIFTADKPYYNYLKGKE